MNTNKVFALGQSGQSQDWGFVLEKQFDRSGLESEKTGWCYKNKGTERWCPEMKCSQWKWKNGDGDGCKEDPRYSIACRHIG